MVEASVVLVKDERQMHWLTRAGLSPSKLRLVQDVAEISAVIHEQLDAGVELAIGRDVQKHYTDYWDRSQGWTPEVSVGDALFSRLFNGLIAPGHAVLDVGCGDCRNYQLRLREMGARLVGVEVSPLAADEARQAGFEVYKHELSQPLPFHDATFDRAVCVEVVEHLFDPFYCVQQIARVLKPGGILVITTPNFGYFASRLDALFNADLLFKSISDFRNPWRGDHIRFFNLAELTRMLDAAGLKPVKVRSAGNFQCLDFLVVFGGPGRVLSQVLSRRLPSWLAFPAIGDLWPGLFAGTLIVWARRVDGWAER
jgi:2-polyprenyl-3-methyl-5-hydroxy-6-metoxy-1,4-benzoquinol methylase